MPLLTSPIDGLPMKQIHRYGIELDVCPTSGGVWLDKGELEKILAILREEVANERGQHSFRPQPSRDRDWDDDDDDDDRRHYNRGGYKKSKRSSILDIFDF